jgi:hypothetical protein
MAMHYSTKRILHLHKVYVKHFKKIFARWKLAMNDISMTSNKSPDRSVLRGNSAQNTVHDRLYKAMYTIQDSKHRLKEKTIEDAMRDCTFTPKVKYFRSMDSLDNLSPVPARSPVNTSIYEKLRGITTEREKTT